MRGKKKSPKESLKKGSLQESSKVLLNEEVLEALDPIELSDFFTHIFQIPYSRASPTCDLSTQLTTPFFEKAKGAHALFLSWNEDSVFLSIEAEGSFSRAEYPDFEKGDALEVWIDTRDMKSLSYVHRFCHHFLILPEQVQGVQVVEMTRFRGEEKHPLPDPDYLKEHISIDVKEHKGTFSIHIAIRKEVLFGYDPVSFSRMGFALRVHGGRSNRNSVRELYQFPVSSEECKLEKYPALWATCELVRA